MSIPPFLNLFLSCLDYLFHLFTYTKVYIKCI